MRILQAVAARTPAHVRPAALATQGFWWLGDRLGRRRYRILSEDELLATRTSDTAFVFGSGRSLLDIREEEWSYIASCNTVSLREFPRQTWVRADYHLTSEVDFLGEYAQRLRENPLYSQTVFVVQGGFRALRGNELIARRLLNPGSRVYRFRRFARGVNVPPSQSFARGLAHGYSSIFDGVNLAYLVGYRRIVLAGVDLYNKEYFWLPAGVTRTYEKVPVEADDPFVAGELIAQMMGDWRDYFAARGVELLVMNPASRLAERIPVFRDPS